jgi:predicted NBD/HSP70 family sugar kinase
VPVRSGSTQEEVRRHNLQAVLHHVHLQGPTSRADLAAATGLNRSTIRALTADLARHGIVRERPPPAGGRSRAGRPSLVVAPEAHRFGVLAVDVTVDKLVVAWVGLGGQIIDRREHETTRRAQPVAAVVELLGEMADDLLGAEAPWEACIGVGASVCGVVQREDGLVRFAPNLGWVDAPFGELLRARLGRPATVLVGNDADLGALAEHTRGAATGSDHVLYISGEVGVGGGIIADGHQLHGRGGYAGEFGHVVVNPTGRRCRCGSRGCWETEIGEDAVLVAAARPPGGGWPAVLEVIAAARAGERAAAAGLRRVGRRLGAGVAGLVNAFNPEVVVFGRVLADVFTATEATVRERISTLALTAPREQVRLVPAQLGEDSALLGAAESAFAPFLADPLRTTGWPTAPFVRERLAPPRDDLGLQSSVSG